MPTQWAFNDWKPSTPIDHARLNDIGESIRKWGYGETPGTVFINANGNDLSNLRTLTFAANGSITGPGGTVNVNHRIHVISAAADAAMLFGEGTSSNEYGYMQWVRATNRWVFGVAGAAEPLYFDSNGIYMPTLTNVVPPAGSKRLYLDAGFVKVA